MEGLAELLGESPQIEAVRQSLRRLLAQPKAGRRLPSILIGGETGTGKGLVAKLIHRHGPRARGPFVDVNCAAIPEALLEAELFGFEQGAFTDARRAKPGLFQTAHRGTIFLDEVGLLPLPLQAKLLKVLEDHAVRRLGSTTSEPVDVWVLSATNENLSAAIATGRFREDLYHRLAVLTVELPPLRQRGRDAVLLAERFLASACVDYGLPVKRLAPEAQTRLLACPWSGNVRELANTMERVALLTDGLLVEAENLDLPVAASLRAPTPAPPLPAPVSLDEVMRQQLLATLIKTGWNISHTATQLDISRNTVRARIKKYQLQPEETAEASADADAAESAPALLDPTPAPLGRVGVRWESRRLALLRVVLTRRESAGREDEGRSVEAGRTLDMVIQKVEAFGGRVLEMGVTGIVAAFGLEPVEDAPRRAALAAMAMHKATRRDEDGQTEGLTIRSAIHAMQIPIARMGAVADLDTDAKQQAGSLLEALITAARPGAIVVSQPTASLLARRFAVERTSAGEMTSGPVYALTDYLSTPFDLGGRMGRFVGREHELDLLRSRLEAARQGQGQLVSLVGEAGIGKSRLLFELRQSLAGEPVTYVEGHCLSYGSAVPYLPILEILRALSHVAESDPPEEIADKIRRGLHDLGIDASPADLSLVDLLSAKSAPGQTSTPSPETIKARTFETLRALFVKSSQRAPLVIAIEDLHWIDQTSEEFLTSLAERIIGRPILLIATCRPGYRPPWIEKFSATQIALQPLAPEDSLTVVRVVFGTDDVSDSLSRLILAKAEGNPFFLEELARGAREQGLHSTSLSIPDTVQEVLSARIDRLPPEERRLLQSAAVIGKDFSFEILRAIIRWPDPALRRGLQSLQTGEFVYETSLIPQPEYTFKHSLTQDVAYTTLSSGERQTLHGQIVRAIEELYPDPAAEQVTRLAHHAFKGERWDKAVSFSRRAGAMAVARSASSEAVACFEQALLALQHLSESRETFEQAIDIRLDLQGALVPLGERERMLAYLREADRIAETLGDQRRVGRVAAYMCHALWWTGDPDRSVESGQRASDIASALGDVALEMLSNVRLGQAYYAAGRYRRAVDVARRSLEVLREHDVRESANLPAVPSVVSQVFLGRSLAALGEFHDGIEMIEAGLRTAERSEHPYSLLIAHWGLGDALLTQGRLARAIPSLERALELSEGGHFALMTPVVSRVLGEAYTLAGRLPDAVRFLERAVERIEAMKYIPALPSAMGALAESYLLAGRPDDALPMAARARQLCAIHGQQGSAAGILRILGMIHFSKRPPDLESARAVYHEALALAEKLEMRPLAARCHLNLSMYYERAGDGQGRDVHLATAVTMLRQMEMKLWLDEIEAKLGGSRIPANAP
jgi:transcriptional regulator with AAA-type ATPase domain/tetratricopeptide (TPR) repeat protein